MMPAAPGIITSIESKRSSTVDVLEQKASKLFLLHYKFVLGLAGHLAPMTDFADDIVNDVFLEFVKHAHRWDLDADIKPILIRLTRIASIALWRDRNKMTSESLRRIGEHIQRIAESNTETIDGSEMFALKKCMHGLSEKSFRLIEMRYNEKMSTLEIARTLSLKDAAVRKAISRIRGKLKNCIDRVLRGKNHG